MGTINGRIDWVDTAKGICIVLVVMLHSVAGVEKAADQTGWMSAIVAFATPFRIPAFFLISGLFLNRVIARDWRLYLDRKLVFFAYFYCLWVTIQFAVKSPVFAQEIGWGGTLELYLMSFIQPFGALWFIYMLPIFFIVTKLLHDNAVPWLLVLVGAVALQVAPIHTGILLIDEFASRFVFFYAGYLFSRKVFLLADWARARSTMSLGLLAAWVLANGGVVYLGWSALPVVSLALGAAGAVAVVFASILIVSWGRLDVLRGFGENSIIIYLAFFFPMAVTRVILLELGVFSIGITSLIVTIAAVIGPMILWWMIQKTGIGMFLFRRPQWAYLRGTYGPPQNTQAAVG